MRLDIETLVKVRLITTKAGSAVVETRDTVGPRVFTEMPAGIYRSI